MRRIHLDHNATTPMRPEARAMLLECIDAGLGNASSVHDAGRRARAVVDEARERIAAALDVDEDEVVFTGGGTESNNLAILGACEAAGGAVRVVTTAVEHSAVLEPARVASKRGGELRVTGVDGEGRIDASAIAAAARGASGPVLVSVMSANNEVGSTASLGAIREAIGDDPILHTDAVQALGKRPLELDGVDLASFSAHKVGGPLGTGVLVRRRGRAITARTFGGAQEGELRPGTENVPAIASAAVAIELAVRDRIKFADRTRELVRELWSGLRDACPNVALNGPPIDDPDRLPNTLNVSLGIGDARTLVTRLDLLGLEVSAGSACASGSIEPSHVLRAMFEGDERASHGVRMSLGRTTTREDVHTVVDRLRTTLGNSS